MQLHIEENGRHAEGKMTWLELNKTFAVDQQQIKPPHIHFHSHIYMNVQRAATSMP